jgi:ABC-type multidrug transport system fused ATPase/permease subunit
VIAAYAKGMGKRNLILGVVTGLTTYMLMAFNDLWLASFVSKSNPTQHQNLVFSIVYAAGCLGYLVCLLLTSAIFTRAGVRSSQHLHDHCMERLLHAPITWFESTPSGRILARFSTDLGMVDQVLSRFTDNLFQLLATVLALIVVVCVLVPEVTIIILISSVLFSAQVLAVDKSNREIKREANLAMSHVQTVITESVNGRMTLRIMDSSQIFWDRFQMSADAWNKQSFLSLSMVNMSCLASYALSFLISTGTGLFIVLGRELEPATSGLALTYRCVVCLLVS